MVWPYGIWPFAVSMQLEDAPRKKKEKKKQKEDKKKKKAETERVQNYPWHLYGHPVNYASGSPVYSSPVTYIPYNQTIPYISGQQSVFPPYGAPAMDPKNEKVDSNEKSKDKDKLVPKEEVEAVWHYLYPGQAPAHPHGWKDVNGITHYNWIGRTRAEVIEDDHHVAANSGTMKQGEMVPKDAKPGDMFWVQLTDGSSSLRNFAEITTSMTGDWIKDPNHGHMYFKKSTAISPHADTDTDSDSD